MALVVGGSRGLGLLCARELLAAGHDVALCARDQEETDRAAEGLRQAFLQRQVLPYACDVRDEAAVQRFIAHAESELGPTEVLMHVAGVIQVGPAEAMTMDHFRQAIDTMLWGPIHTVWNVLPGMRERRRGRIGVVTSIGGKVAPPHLLPYVTAKFGAVGFSEGLSAELAGTGITMTTLVPGLMRTGSQERAMFTGNHGREFAWFGSAASLPLLSMDAEKAARSMVQAVLAGKPVHVLTPLAHVGMRVHGLAPGLTVRTMGLVNRLLPDAPVVSKSSAGSGGTKTGREAAHDVRSPLVGSLTVLGRRAARRYNQRSA